MRTLEILALVIGPLVAQLGHRDFRTRELATVKLEKIGIHALPFLEVRGDAETEARCRLISRKVRHRWQQDVIASIERQWPVLPWIDGLPAGGYPGFDGRWPGDEARYLFDYQARALMPGGYQSPDWKSCRLATKMLVRHLVESGWTRERILAILPPMAAWEKDWKKANPQTGP